MLKPGGVAIFREPVENPIFDRFRNTALMKSIRPNEKSFERHITDDERKLGKQDFIAIAKYFPNFRCENFRMLSRLDVLLPNYASSLERLDRSMSRFKSYSWWRRTSIFILEKEFI